MESANAGIGVTANLYSESSPSRIANPTDFFSHLYFQTRGRGVSQQTLQTLEEQTRTWLGDWSPVDAQKTDSINVGRTRYAYDMRRLERAFGEYRVRVARTAGKASHSPRNAMGIRGEIASHRVDAIFSRG